MKSTSIRWRGSRSLLRSWLGPHRGVAQEKPSLYLAFFQFVHEPKKRGKVRLTTLVEAIVTPKPGMSLDKLSRRLRQLSLPTTFATLAGARAKNCGFQLRNEHFASTLGPRMARNAAAGRPAARMRAQTGKEAGTNRLSPMGAVCSHQHATPHHG
jgi:hypothetical protein